MARLFCFLFGVAVLLAIPAASWAQFQTQQQQQPAPPRVRPQIARPPAENSPAPIVDDRGTEKAPLVVRTLKSNEDSAAELSDRSARALNAIALIVLAGAVIVLGLLQLATFLVTLRTGRRQLRAYVQVNSAKIYNAFDGKSGPIAAHIVVKNFGQTPAHKVMTVNALAVEKYPLPADLNFRVDDKEFSAPGRSKTSLAPGQTEEIVEIARRPELDEKEQRALIDGQLAILVYGEIRFTDVFGRSQRTRYRYMLGGAVGVRSGGSLVACDE
jgi:hypothetical protein